MHRSSVFYFLGGMALFLFGVQVVTGILLALILQAVARPGVRERAPIMTEIDFGWLIRSIHVLERQFADRRAAICTC